MIRITCLMTIGLIFMAISACADNSSQEAAALSAAEEWLMLIDRQ